MTKPIIVDLGTICGAEFRARVYHYAGHPGMIKGGWAGHIEQKEPFKTAMWQEVDLPTVKHLATSDEAIAALTKILDDARKAAGV